MKLAIVNGSPRGKSSNSLRMAHWIMADDSCDHSIHHLYKINSHHDILDSLKDESTILFILPLYVDSMPGLVMQFFEAMEEQKDIFQNKSISFLIHSGFPERIHSRSLQDYLGYFSEKVMGMNYLGTLILAGSEGLQMAPDRMYQRQIEIIQIMKEYLSRNTPFPEELNNRMNRGERMSLLGRLIFRLNPFKHFYWNYRAKKHPFEVNLSARPYE